MEALPDDDDIDKSFMIASAASSAERRIESMRISGASGGS
jgi:hypothetical protein